MLPQTTATNIMSFRTSHWEQTTFLRPAEVAIVGAGLTGLQTAIALKRQRPNLDVLVIERAGIPRGASTRNAGFACFGAPTELLADLDIYGASSMVATVRQRYDGIRKLATDYAERGIDWQQWGGYEVIDDPITATVVREELPRLNTYLAAVTGVAETWREIPPPDFFRNGPLTTDALTVLHNSLEAQLHPGKLVNVLLADAQALGVRFLFGTEITDIVQRGSSHLLQLTGAEIEARRVIVTTNAFARDLLPDTCAVSIRPVRNQILLSRKIPNLKIKGCFHYHEGYVYFRNVGPDRLLIGGGRHRAGAGSETGTFGANGVPEAYLLDKLRAWFPRHPWSEADFPTRWSGIIAQGDGKEPVLAFTDSGVLVAARLAGMGVALSGTLAERAAVLVLATEADPR